MTLESASGTVDVRQTEASPVEPQPRQDEADEQTVQTVQKQQGSEKKRDARSELQAAIEKNAPAAAAEQSKPVRRSSYLAQPLNYVAVSASKDPNLLRFPPAGSIPFEHSLRIGSGKARFQQASASLMTLKAIRACGYSCTLFNRETRASEHENTPTEHYYSEDGTPYLEPGQGVTVQGHDMLVLYTVHEQYRTGYAWGTMHGCDYSSEQLFTVELRDDESVWAIARGTVFGANRPTLKSRVQESINQIKPLQKKFPLDTLKRSRNTANAQPENQAAQRTPNPVQLLDTKKFTMKHLQALLPGAIHAYEKNASSNQPETNAESTATTST